MSAPAPIQRTVDIDDAVELIWSSVLDGKATSAREAAAALWPTLSFSGEDYEALALFGLSERAGLNQHYRHSTRRPAIGYGAPHGKKFQSYVALTWPYEGADGRQKPLLSFTRDDLAALSQRAHVMAKSWQRRYDWALQTDKRLAEYHVDTIRELPAAVLTEVEALALEALGSQE